PAGRSSTFVQQLPRKVLGALDRGLELPYPLQGRTRPEPGICLLPPVGITGLYLFCACGRALCRGDFLLRFAEEFALLVICPGRRSSFGACLYGLACPAFVSLPRPGPVLGSQDCSFLATGSVCLGTQVDRTMAAGRDAPVVAR